MDNLEFEEVNDYIEFPIISVLGDRGDGKTLVMTALAWLNQKVAGLKVFANYHLLDIPYTYITFEELANFPEDLEDAIVLLDETHIGVDAYEVFRKNNKAITKFSTQLRKRRIVLLWSTQRFNTVAKRLRQMTNYVLEVEKTNIKGIIQCRVYDRGLEASNSFVKEFVLDGRQFFGMYDTNEIIDE